MALIKCNECGKEISDKALVCPNCGFEYKKINKQSKQMKTGSIVSLIACSCILASIILLIIFSYMPQIDTRNSHKNADVTVEIGESYVEFTKTISFYLIGFISTTLVSFLLTILFLCHKIRFIKLYKILLILFSLAQILFWYGSTVAIICCGIILAIFPIMNFVGAIVVATGKESYENIKDY